MQENTNSLNFIQWVKTYPKKAIIFLLLIVVPLILIVLSIVKFNNTSNRFYFDKVNNQPVYLTKKNITKKKTFDKYFDTFEIKLTNLNYLNVGEENASEEYVFSGNVILNEDYENATLNYKYVFATKHYDRQSDFGTKNINGSFNLKYPYLSANNKNKLLVLKSGMPSLYVQVTITIPTSLPEIAQPKEIVLIYKLDLNKINYNYNVD